MLKSTLFGLLVVAAILASAGLGWRFAGRGPEATREPASDIVLYSKGEPVDIGDAAAALATARRVASRAEFEKVVGPQSVIVLDRSAMGDVDRQFLHARLESGTPIFGLNVSRADLSDATGYRDSLIARDARMVGMPPFSPPPAEPFYSVVWVSARAHDRPWWNGDSEKDFASRLFAADLKYHASLTRRLPDGKVAPLARLAQ